MLQPNCTSWHKLEYVEPVVQGEECLQIYVEQVEQGEGGLQIVVEQVEQGQGVCPAEPLHLFQSGSTRPWTRIPAHGTSKVITLTVSRFADSSPSTVEEEGVMQFFQG